MRILWHSVKPNIPTGYGTQTKLFVQGLCKRGYDVDTMWMYLVPVDYTAQWSR